MLHRHCKFDVVLHSCRYEGMLLDTVPNAAPFSSCISLRDVMFLNSSYHTQLYMCINKLQYLMWNYIITAVVDKYT